MKLYSHFRSTASYRVRIALALKGIRYETVGIKLRDHEQRGAPFRERNPQGRVPALELDGGAVLMQSLAIIDYLDETHPEPALLPKDPVARAHVRAVAQIVCCDIHPLINNIGARERLIEQFGASEEAANDWNRYWITEGFRGIEPMLKPGPYAFGEQVTLADLCIVPQVFAARRFKVALEEFPKIVAADAACHKHPAFALAAPEAQPDAA